jgi:hypothetical protein
MVKHFPPAMLHKWAGEGVAERKDARIRALEKRVAKLEKQT